MKMCVLTNSVNPFEKVKVSVSALYTKAKTILEGQKLSVLFENNCKFSL